MTETTYSEAILEGFNYLLENHPDVCVLGQGLWSPWYVGSSMTDLDVRFGRDRVMDTPVSEDATTAIAGGLSLCGYRPIVVHPRIDFMVLASNSLVNQIAKWSHMLGGASRPNVTIRGIVNRGGEQGAQHSQSLHSWFSHIPGLRVVMPALASDARDLLISSVLCDDPVLYIDDRWCYEDAAILPEVSTVGLEDVRPRVVQPGEDITLAAAGYSVHVALEVRSLLASSGISAEVVDLRVLNPFYEQEIVDSVSKTGRLAAIDGSWKTCGFAGEIIASVSESMSPTRWRATPQRFTLPEAPAPTSRSLEAAYYASAQDIAKEIGRCQFTDLSI